ncbi:Uma2 family endonuclease [Dehalococcoidia bacterium]|nr:Uma2 family endonuclease [Dehalococcoidia bacterium]MCL0069692.1 Uma2 family endonuclease [Dehalococcoidia bacterium]MCL0079239.1 Uma2 family endonuclease [Dehalococcoidia bacterium]MCL0088830.1 Uma2 family endonuclease [Dehalococcoidia bacterium]
MSVLKEKIRFTYEDYLRLPNDRKQYQIIEGEVCVVPSPAPRHQDTLRKLTILLSNFVERHKLGRVYIAPCDVILSDEDVVQPDIFFISNEREYIIAEKNIQGVPDLVVEILSASSAKLDRALKMKLYERFGVKEYWLVDPVKEEIEALTLEGEGYQSLGVFGIRQSFESLYLTGLKVDLREVF